jgi:hypothetical protein
MKDQRIPLLRKTLGSLLESIEAMLRVRRWEGPDEIPAPLKQTAHSLVEQLSTADRLTATVYRGNPADVGRAEAIVAALRRLDTAYVSFLRSVERAPGALEAAAAALTQEIDQVKAR